MTTTGDAWKWHIKLQLQPYEKPNLYKYVSHVWIDLWSLWTPTKETPKYAIKKENTNHSEKVYKFLSYKIQLQTENIRRYHPESVLQLLSLYN